MFTESRRKSVCFTSRLTILALLLLLNGGFAVRALAATRTWTGTTSGNWTIAGNWGGTAPVAGDDLVFPVGAARFNTTNNFTANTVFHTVLFTGSNYVCQGNAVALSGTPGLRAQYVSGTSTFNPDVRLDASLAFECLNNSFVLGGNINLNGFNLTNSSAGLLTLSGVISGTGNMVRKGAATVVIQGAAANTYIGTTYLNSGQTDLSKSSGVAIPGNLVVGDDLNSATVRVLVSNQLANSGDVTVNQSSALNFNLNNTSDTIHALALHGGTVATGSGTLTVGGNITCLVETNPIAASITGNLSLGALTRTIDVQGNLGGIDFNLNAAVSSTAADAGLLKIGPGRVALGSSNSYGGLTTINAGIIQLGNNFALGTSGGSTNGTIVNSGASLYVVGNAIGNEFLTLDGGTLFGSGMGSWAGPVTLNGSNTNNVSGTNTITGAISGSGGLTKIGTGMLSFAGVPGNSYAGTTWVKAGTLFLDRDGIDNAVVGPLIIGDGSSVATVQHDQSKELGSSSITINAHGTLDLNGHNDEAGPLTFNGGQIATGVGVLTMNGDVTVNGSSPQAAIAGNLIWGSATRTLTVANGAGIDLTISANVSGPGGLIKAGPGQLWLSASNNYTGNTVLNGGNLDVVNSFALGATNGGTVINTGVLGIWGGIQVGFESLTNNGGSLYSTFGSNSWAGRVQLAANTTVNVPPGEYLNFSGVIEGPSALTKIGEGTLVFSGSGVNTYTSTLVSQGTLLLNKSGVDASIRGTLDIGDDFGASNAIVRLGIGEQLQDATSITVHYSGVFDLNGVSEWFGSLAGSGGVTLGAATPKIGFNGLNTLYSGVISGSGGIEKLQTGSLTLTGYNSYTGGTLITGGTLFIDSYQPQSAVTVTNAILSGKGTVKSITSRSGVVSPGSSPGILTSSGNLTLDPFTTFYLELNGAVPGSGHDQVILNGTNNLGSASLYIVTGPAFAPLVGQPITIIRNDSAVPVVGTFGGIPNNGSIFVNGQEFIVSYFGGTGNDVTLTLANSPLVTESVSVRAGNGNSLLDRNECNNLDFVIHNSTPNPVTGITATLSSTNSGVVITQGSSAYSNIAGGASGTNLSSFQVSVLPSVPCGSVIYFELAVSTANAGTFSVPYMMFIPNNIGATFQNITPMAILDLTTNDSPMVVTNFNEPLTDVIVSLYLTHSFIGDLKLSLIAPDGTVVLLSGRRGSNGGGYGTACNARVTFTDSAAVSITNTPTPYVGFYKPEQPLAAFAGKSGTNVNGVWKLRVVDEVNVDTGALICWSLNLTASCPSGAGVCELCPNVTLRSELGNASHVQQQRMTRDGTPSICGVQKVCPGLYDSGFSSTLYEAHTFRNGPSSACITVTLTAPTADLYSAAFLGSLSVDNPCPTYLADAGNSTLADGIPTVRSYSFNVAANAVFVVQVNGIENSFGPYQLSVTGGDCSPALNIGQANANNLRLDWSTSAGGYRLESAPALAPNNWTVSPAQPLVSAGRYIVTNAVSPANGFYRLHKP